jgi:hypothetical protein
MKSQLISDDYDRPAPTNQKSFAIIFDDGDEVMADLKKFAEEKRLAASHFTAIGARKEHGGASEDIRRERSRLVIEREG